MPSLDVAPAAVVREIVGAPWDDGGVLIQVVFRWLVEALKAPFERHPDPTDVALAELRSLTRG